MLTVKEIKPNVYELTLQDVVDKADIETMARELTPALNGDAPLGLVIRAEGWKDMTANAIVEDVKFEFGLLSKWVRVGKMALVTDLQVFSAVLKWIDPILPMIEMRSFGSADVAAAEAFAADLPARSAAAPENGVTLLADGSDGVIAYEIDGLITRKDVEKVMAPLAPVLQGDGKINLLVTFKDYGGFDPAILTDGSLMGAKIGSISHLGRYAVVGAPAWMKAMASGVAPMMPFEMRLFDAAEEGDARAWVGLK